MADVTMAVFESTRIVGIPDWTVAAGVRAGNAAAGSNWYFPNDGMTFIILYEAGAGETMTFLGKNDKYGRPSADLTFQVATGDTGIVGPFSPALWNDVDGLVRFALTIEDGGSFLLAVRITNSQRNGV